jgi:hypothetical protein
MLISERTLKLYKMLDTQIEKLLANNCRVMIADATQKMIASIAG